MTAIALTIAGSDPSGGAGIQADLKTFHRHGVYGTSVLTLVTAQNTTRVSRVEVLAADLVVAQLDAVLEDVPPRAAKTGALGSARVVRAIAERARAFAFPLVVDPVMISKHGAALIDAPARDVLARELVPSAALVTPNAHEAAALSGRPVRTIAEARDAARAIADRGARAVLVKGGHVGEGGARATDVLFAGGVLHEIDGPRIATRHTHGTGCTYSAAITAHLARGLPLADAVHRAKEWLTEALRTAPGIGGGAGPVNHFA